MFLTLAAPAEPQRYARRIMGRSVNNDVKGTNHPPHVPFYVVFLRNWRQIEADFCPFYAVAVRNKGHMGGDFVPFYAKERRGDGEQVT